MGNTDIKNDTTRGFWDKWFWKFLVPMFVGITLIFLGSVYSILSEKGMQLGHTVNGPTTLLDSSTLDATVTIDDVGVSSVSVYTVVVKNIGDVPIKNLHVSYVFDSPTANFKILRVRHKTKPPVEFGHILEDTVESNRLTKRFTYELMNPHDEVTVTFFIDGSAELSTHAKSEGLIVQRLKSDEESRAAIWTLVFWSVLTLLTACALTVIVGLLTKKYFFSSK